MFERIIGGLDVGEKVVGKPDKPLPVAGQVIEPDDCLGHRQADDQDNNNSDNNKFSFLFS